MLRVRLGIAALAANKGRKYNASQHRRNNMLNFHNQNLSML
jgi:hypothetical protein